MHLPHATTAGPSLRTSSETPGVFRRHQLGQKVLRLQQVAGTFRQREGYDKTAPSRNIELTVHSFNAQVERRLEPERMVTLLMLCSRFLSRCWQLQPVKPKAGRPRRGGATARRRGQDDGRVAVEGQRAESGRPAPADGRWSVHRSQGALTVALTMTRTRTQTALTKLATRVACVHGELAYVDGRLAEKLPDPRRAGFTRRRDELLAIRSPYATRSM